MGLPKIQFTPDAIWSFVANHIEKILVAIVILCSLPLAWGGINALRLKTRTSAEEPAVIIELVTNAKNLLSQPLSPDQQKELTKKIRATKSDEHAALESWNPTDISRLSVDAGFDRPLLGDIQRRQIPVIFPLERLVATAGIVAIADQDELLARSDSSLEGGFPDMEMPGNPTGSQAALTSPPAKKMPYVILTGLIPYRKQFDEYISLYSRASYRNMERDIPIWHDFAVERLEITPRGSKWEVIDLARLYEEWKNTWNGAAADTIPQQFILPEAQNLFNPDEVPVGYWCPLPTLAPKPTLRGVDSISMGDSGDGPTWGVEAIHPWAKDEMKILLEDQKKLALEQQGGVEFSGQGMGSGMEFGGEIAGQSRGTFSPFRDAEMASEGDGMTEEYDNDMMMGYGQDGESMMNELDYRLFRFIDTSVKPGCLYRYRITLRAWNPNWMLPRKFLEDPKSAEQQFIQAATSDTFPSLQASPLHVPPDNVLLTRLLLREEKKLYGLGVSDQELLVLDSNKDSGNFELHSITSKPGQVVGCKKGSRKIKQWNNKRISVPSHNVDSGQTLLAVTGQQTIDGKKRPGRGFIPPEPFEVIIANAAGTLDVITADSCEETVREYLPTIPGYQPPRQDDSSIIEGMEPSF